MIHGCSPPTLCNNNLAIISILTSASDDVNIQVKKVYNLLKPQSQEGHS